MPKYVALIGLAGVLGLMSFSALIQKIYDTHNTTSLPWIWLGINITAQVLSLFYGFANNAYGIIIPNLLFLAGLFYILYVKLNHKPKDENKQL